MGFILLLSCGDGGSEETKQNGVIYADVMDYGDPDFLGGEAMLYCDVMVDTSDFALAINGVELEKDEWEDPYPNFVFWGNVPKADPSNLSFTSSALGNASASARIPGSTDITSPADEDTFPMGQDVNVIWNQTSCDFYWLDVDIEFYDNSGGYLDGRSYSGYTTSTSYTIPGDSLAYSGATYAEVSFGILPVYGPIPDPGTHGNITGDIEGFFYTVNEGAGVFFYVGTPKAYVMRRPKEFSNQRFLMSIRELLGY